MDLLPTAEHVAQRSVSPVRNREPIAITGIGCRFPGEANSPETFWQLLCLGRDAIREVPLDRWDVSRFYHEDPDKPGRTYSKWGGFLDQLDRFDAQFFGISPREAVHIDPPSAACFEVAWEALGTPGGRQRLSGSDTGVFIGISSHDYSDIQVKATRRREAVITRMRGRGASPPTACPTSSTCTGCFAVDTACSSSLSRCTAPVRASGTGELSALAGDELHHHAGSHYQLQQGVDALA